MSNLLDLNAAEIGNICEARLILCRLQSAGETEMKCRMKTLCLLGELLTKGGEGEGDGEEEPVTFRFPGSFSVSSLAYDAT